MVIFISYNHYKKKSDISIKSINVHCGFFILCFTWVNREVHVVAVVEGFAIEAIMSGTGVSPGILVLEVLQTQEAIVGD